MKRLVLLLALLAIGLGLRAQTELYDRYKRQPGVKVAAVSGFAIDSASRVDVTVVEAETDDAWRWMRSEFGIGELAPEQRDNLAEGSDVVLFARRNRHDPKQNAPIVHEQVDMASSCYMGISYLDRAVYIFCADSDEEYDAVVALLVKKMLHSR